MEDLIKNINQMIQTTNKSIEFNNVVNEINRSRVLGSSNQCYRSMYMIAQYFNVQKVLEIGTHQGASSIVFCQAIVDNKKAPEIHTVDNWSQSGLIKNESDKFKKIAEDNIKKAGFIKYITMYDGDSLTKVPEILDVIGDVDLVFIDGDHELDYIIGDYNNCKRYSDMILFHDTEQGAHIGTDSYFGLVESDGYTIYNFKTRYLEGDGHVLGIALAIK